LSDNVFSRTRPRSSGEPVMFFLHDVNAGRPQRAGGKLDVRSCGPGGARRSRTDDILLAKQALYQLSYGPVLRNGNKPRRAVGDLSVKPAGLVGTGRLELPTLRLSGVRSNHLSYAPMAATARLFSPGSRSHASRRRPVWPTLRSVKLERETETAAPRSCLEFQ
jgi:hypothetical protein